MTWAAMNDLENELVHALQVRPRASWAQLGELLHCSPATVRRAWLRLTGDGRAWITSYPGPAAGIVIGTVDLQAKPGHGAGIAAALASHPRAVTVSSMTGGRDLNALVFAKDLAEFREVTQVEIPALPGVSWTRNAVVTTMYADGADWARRQRPGGDEPGEPRRLTSAGADRWELLPVFGALERDGRAAYTALARPGLGAAQVSRQVEKSLASGALRQRVEVSPGTMSGQIAMCLWLQVPPQHVDAAGAKLSAHPATRLCASLAGGSANLYVIAWLSSFGEATQIEAGLMERFPAVVLDRSIVVHYHKRLGWLFDAEGRRVGHVPWLGEWNAPDVLG